MKANKHETTRPVIVDLRGLLGDHTERAPVIDQRPSQRCNSINPVTDPQRHLVTKLMEQNARLKNLARQLIADRRLTVAQYLVCVACLLYTSPSPRDGLLSRMPSSA